MKYLLDTHTVLWYMGNSPVLPAKIKEIIVNSENSISVCSVSLWETAIKVNLGKLKLSLTFDDFLAKIRNSDFNMLQIGDEYLKKLSVLPFIHKDPFDRLLIATALVENLTIVTKDNNIQKYDVSWIW